MSADEEPIVTNAMVQSDLQDEIDKLDRIASELQDTCHKQSKQLAEAYKEIDSVVYARDKAYQMLAECEKERDEHLRSWNRVVSERLAVEKERDAYKASYLEQVELHNKTLDELAAAEALCKAYREALESVVTSGDKSLALLGEMMKQAGVVSIPLTGEQGNLFIQSCADHAELKKLLATTNPTAALNKAIAEELWRMADEIIDDYTTVWARQTLRDRADELEKQ